MSFHPEGAYAEIEEAARRIGRRLTETEVLVLGLGVGMAAREAAVLHADDDGLWLSVTVDGRTAFVRVFDASAAKKDTIVYRVLRARWEALRR